MDVAVKHWLAAATTEITVVPPGKLAKRCADRSRGLRTLRAIYALRTIAWLANGQRSRLCQIEP